MKDLIRTAAILALIFASTFIVLRLLGWLTVDNVRAMLEAAHALDRRWVAAVVIAVLFADLFVAVPTLTTCVLAGYFLGAQAGSLAAATGMLVAGGSGYLISRRWGEGLLLRVLRDPHRLAEMRHAFEGNGFAVLLICRALPILPEVSCCMAGLTRMPWLRFVTAFVIGTVPYACIAAYAGSRSSLANPTPALLTAAVLSGGLWLIWAVWLRRRMATRMS